MKKLFKAIINIFKLLKNKYFFKENYQTLSERKVIREYGRPLLRK